MDVHLRGNRVRGQWWSDCPAPITISIDARGLARDQRKKAKAALNAALTHWNRGSVVRFQYVGPIRVDFDPSTGISSPQDGQSRDRHIYLTMVDAGRNTTVDPGVVGLATPLRVDPATRIILEGSAAFRASCINRKSRAKVTEVVAHELGHVFGLGPCPAPVAPDAPVG